MCLDAQSQFSRVLRVRNCVILSARYVHIRHGLTDFLDDYVRSYLRDLYRFEEMICVRSCHPVVIRNALGLKLKGGGREVHTPIAYRSSALRGKSPLCLIYLSSAGLNMAGGKCKPCRRIGYPSISLPLTNARFRIPTVTM